MNFTIRAFQPADYPALADLAGRVEPEFPASEAELRFHDDYRDPRVLHGRLLADVDGEVVGEASWGQSAGMLHEGHFGLGVGVAPEHRRRGIGTALYDAALTALADHNAVQLVSDAQDGREHSLSFLHRRGYVENMREWESRLDLTAFDPAAFAADETRLSAEGIDLLTYAELAGDRDRHRKMHHLQERIEQDIPAPDPPTPTDFAVWERKLLANPRMLPEAWVFAVHQGEYIGFTSLWKPDLGGYLDTGYTGVLPAFRRKGVAFALKARSLAAVRGLGVPEVRTWNATTNDGMLAVNGRLGFRRHVQWIFFKKHL